MKFDAKFLQSDNSKIILGIIWGLGLACIFRCACEGRKCIIYKAPNPAKIKNKIYGHQEKCYTYETSETTCTDDAI